MKSRVRIPGLDVSTARAILDALASDQDPVKWKGQDTTVQDIDDGLERDTPAHQVVVEFYGANHRVVKGTLVDMIVDRMGIKVAK